MWSADPPAMHMAVWWDFLWRVVHEPLQDRHKSQPYCGLTTCAHDPVRAGPYYGTHCRNSAMALDEKPVADHSTQADRKNLKNYLRCVTTVDSRIHSKWGNWGPAKIPWAFLASVFASQPGRKHGA